MRVASSWTAGSRQPFRLPTVFLLQEYCAVDQTPVANEGDCSQTSPVSRSWTASLLYEASRTNRSSVLIGSPHAGDAIWALAGLAVSNAAATTDIKAAKKPLLMHLLLFADDVHPMRLATIGRYATAAVRAAAQSLGHSRRVRSDEVLPAVRGSGALMARPSDWELRVIVDGDTLLAERCERGSEAFALADEWRRRMLDDGWRQVVPSQRPAASGARRPSAG